MRIKPIYLIALLLITLLVAACDPTDTNDSANDAAAAQQYIPHPAGYAEHPTDNIQDAIANTLAGAGIVTGNPVQGVLINQISSFVDCYRDVGAFDARVHVQNINVSAVNTPVAGVVGVINQDRIVSNFLNCATPLRSQTLDAPNPCAGGGSFEAAGDTFTFIYAASSPELCSIYQAHFNQFQPQG
jgi:hypothetical protein